MNNTDDLKRLLEGQINDPSDACKSCRRTATDFLLEKHHSGFLPYGTCSGCACQKYARHDPTHKALAKDKKWTILAALVIGEDWEKASERLALYPKEAERVCGSHSDDNFDSLEGEYEERSALYFAVENHAPLDLIQKLAKAAPNEICNVFYNYQLFSRELGWGPPEIEEHTFRSPLQLAIYKATDSDLSVEMVKSLLKVYLEDASRAKSLPYKSLVALDQAWDKIRKPISIALSRGMPIDKNIFQVLAKGNENRFSILKRCWETLLLLYRALHYKTLDQDQSVLQAITFAQTCRECPKALFRFAVKMYPEELETVDPSSGNLILHSLSAKLKHLDTPSSAQDLDFRPKPSYVDYDEGPFEDLIEELEGHYEIPRIKIVSEICPRTAAIPNRDGSLALHIAIRAGRKWADGVSQLVSAHPDALKCVEPSGPMRGMTPFMQAATLEAENESYYECDCWEANNLDLIYNLLRRCPEPSVLFPSPESKSPSRNNKNESDCGANEGTGERDDCLFKPAKKKRRV